MDQPARSLLFVPGNRPDRFEKALASGADMVAVDLEDAVAPPEKQQARAHGLAFITGSHGNAIPVLRVNGLQTAAGLADLAAVADAAPDHGLVMLPKVDAAAEIHIADAVLTEAASPVGLVALIESLEGLENVHDIAAASPRLRMLMFGGADFAAELGVPLAREPLLYARSRIVHAAKRAAIGVLDVPTIAFRDDEQVRADAVYAKQLGFTGKAAVHPANVATINAAFSPTDAELADARKVVDAFDPAAGVAVVDGKFVDAPVVAAMRSIIAIARSEGRA